MNTFIVILAWLSTAFSQKVMFPVGRNGDQMKNLLFKDDTFYVAENGMIHMVDKDLTSIGNFSTCDGVDCDNINKVLTFSGDLLVLCGTGNGGICQAWNRTHFIYNSSTIIAKDNYLVVSTDPDIPAVGLVHEGSLVLGVTYGAGIEETRDTPKTYKYLLSKTKIREKFSREANVNLKDLQYKVYFKSIFRYENFIYILSNQKYDSNVNSQNISKLIRICINETYNNYLIKTYTDLILSCDAGGVNYNLVRDAAFFPSTRILVAGFSKGKHPESPEQQSAVCVYTLDAITDAINKAKEDYIICNRTEDTGGSYLERDLNKCLTEGNYTILKNDYFCPSAGNGVKVTSSNKITANSSHKLNDTISSLTKMYGFERYNMFPDVVYGTDMGYIGKITVDNTNVIHEYDHTEKVDNHPVTDIHLPEDEDRLYILTSRKLFRLENSRCNDFKSYIHTVDGKNPSCGWCFDTNSATKQPDCPTGKWISSLLPKVTVDISPKYIPINKEAVLNLTIGNLPSALTNDLKCSYVDETDTNIGGQVAAMDLGNDLFQCSIPTISRHVKVQVQIKSTSLYGTAEVQVYDCQQYKSCDKCRESLEIDCKWCSSRLTCQDSGLQCSEAVQGNDSECPRIFENPNLYIPAGIQKNITLNGVNLINDANVLHKCNVNSEEFDAIVLGSSTLKCEIVINFDEDTAKTPFPITVVQEYSSKHVEIMQINQNIVTVYKCEEFATDCTLCMGLNKTRYDCNWCNSRCEHNSVCTVDETCPQPQVTGVIPASGGYRGGTELTISVKNLGNFSPIHVTVGSVRCRSIQNASKDDSDFEDVPIGLTCTLERRDDPTRIGLQNVTVVLHGGNNEPASTANLFSFKDPRVSKLSPNNSSSAGGALITLTGSDLDVGGRINLVSLVSKNNSQLVMLNHAFIYPNIITCITPNNSAARGTEYKKVRLTIDEEAYDSELSFTFNGAPELEDIPDIPELSSIQSGGIKREFKGTNLDGATKKMTIVNYGGDETRALCEIEEGKSDALLCSLPRAPDSVIEELRENMGSRKKRSVSDGSIVVHLIVQLDGYSETFTMKYYRDPIFEMFIGEETTRLFKSDEHELTIQGQYINLVGTEDDYKVYIGPSSECTVITVTESNLTCRPPVMEEQATPPPVTVVLGSFNASIGYVRYVKVEVPPEKLLAIILPVIGGVLLVFLVLITIGVIKYRGVKGKAMKFEKNLADMELQIKKVFREEFLDMHTTMSRVNESLIEKGFPYNNYQRYCFLMMFPGEWNMEEHPLMHEPVVSKRKVSDHIRGKLKQGMDQFEELLKNKFFLVSIVSTMEKQKKFFLKEKSNMAGHLSVALLGKMEYVHEVLSVLLTKLVDETPAKSQKTLFRRCESITEKLLSNWLVLSLYPHVKLHSGSPLYMLLKGTQLTMESGPIDALTGDSKYTLSEDKLLRQDDKPNTLTLKIMVDNSDEIRECKVLDCDTISQVKAKCLSQIYVNFPASQLTVESSDLNLEWHWGTGGRLMIQDEDTTSKREGQWLRLNTLEHYSVTDGSSMALVDPHGVEQEDYVNLANIRIDTGDPGCNGSVHSNDPLTPPDEESVLVERWHLVKPDNDQQKPESVVVEELYLNRLITTKQSVLEYMKNLFDTILSSTVPPPTKFLFDFLDNLGEKNKVESDTLHAWKSQCYTIRFWATLINKPYNLFDQRIPSYVETSMEVISQVLIESCSLKAPEYTKDSSPGKLIFKKDMMDYRDKVKEYYTQVKTVNQDSDDLRLYLKDLNKFQQQQLGFNRQAALYSLYAQLQPYMDEIMDDLESNDETKSLHLDRKLTTLNNFMQED